MPASSELDAVRRRLLAWYGRAHRDFPWRRTRDPYAVLVSEVMLQQTQAGRVVERFQRFLHRFPTVDALASAAPADVLEEWSGLGYNRRAVALQQTAVQVRAEGWPRDTPTLQRLPGVGPYTARAIASLAFGEPIGVVDTNVRRWLLRRFAVEDSPRQLQDLADGLASVGAPGADDAAAWTHATMEFGAGICRSRDPRCDVCPVAAGCPSRGAAARVAVPRQAAYAGSVRARRGSLLRALSGAPDHALSLSAARMLVGGDGFDALITRLEHERLVHRAGGIVRLGGAAGSVATIDP